MNNKDLLNLIDITVSFEGFLALNKLNLNLKKGELRAVIGPNGAGKTTFLDVITGSSTNIKSGFCPTNMAISSHCFWPCDKDPALESTF